MRISDWSSDVCSSDLGKLACRLGRQRGLGPGQESIDLGELLPQLRLGTTGGDRRPEARESLLDLKHQVAVASREHRLHRLERSEERRGGKGWVGTCRTGRSPENTKKKKNKTPE